MKKQGKLSALLPKILSGDKPAIVKAEKILYEHLTQFSSNLRPPKRKRQVTYITHLMHDSLPLSEIGLSDKERAHLLALAARQIRRVISELNSKGEKDHPIKPTTTVGLHDNPLLGPDEHAVDFISIDKYLKELTKLDQNKAMLFEMAYFGGMNYEEMAEIVAMTIANVDRELRFARAWLCTKIADN